MAFAWYGLSTLWLGGLLSLLLVVPFALRWTRLAPPLAEDMLLEVGHWQVLLLLPAVLLQLLLLVSALGLTGFWRDLRSWLLLAVLLMAGASLWLGWGRSGAGFHLGAYVMVALGLLLFTRPAPTQDAV